MLSAAERKLIVSEFDRQEFVHLSEVSGRVRSTRDFAAAHIGLLRPFERGIVRNGMHTLAAECPFDFVRPLAIQSGATGAGVKALRSGSRSALLHKENIYLKGCRPRVDRPDLFFPSFDISVETGAVEEARVPFGVMTAEGVMREIMGYLVHQSSGWDYARTPAAVLEYEADDLIIGYAIAFSLEPGFLRIEKLLAPVNFSVEDLLAVECIREVVGLDLSPGEWVPQGVPVQNYYDMKVSRMAALHAAGYFRGYLNSNTGNDLLHLGLGPGALRLALVDFDTFQAVSVADATDVHAQRIVEFGCVEAAKSLLPLFDFVFTDLADRDAAFKRVESRLRHRTSMLALYERTLQSELLLRGWQATVIEAGFERAKRNPLYRSCVLDLVPNAFQLCNSYESQLSLYSEQLH